MVIRVTEVWDICYQVTISVPWTPGPVLDVEVMRGSVDSVRRDLALKSVEALLYTEAQRSSEVSGIFDRVTLDHSGSDEEHVQHGVVFRLRA